MPFNDLILHIVVGAVVGKLSLQLNYKDLPPDLPCKFRVNSVERNHLFDVANISNHRIISP